MKVTDDHSITSLASRLIIHQWILSHHLRLHHTRDVFLRAHMNPQIGLPSSPVIAK